MRKGQGFRAGVVVVAFSFVLAAETAAGPKPDFTFGSASVNEIVYTLGSVPVSCEGPADSATASDSYQWRVKLAKIKGDFLTDLANNIVTVAFSSGSCNSITDVTNTLQIPPEAAYIYSDSSNLYHVDFDGAVPDFSSQNTSNDIDLPFFDSIGFHLVYNPPGGSTSTVGTLKPGAGTLEVTGNANLCGVITSTQPQQCFILDLALGDPTGSNADLSCICVTPSPTYIDITSFLE